MPERRTDRSPAGVGENGDLEASLVEMTRHPLLELADELSGEGELRKREEGDAGPFLQRFVRFLEGKKHALIGGLAVRAFVRLRPTMDFDVMIDSGHWDEMRRFLSREAAESTGAVEDTFLYTLPAIGLNLDVRVAKTALDIESLESAGNRKTKWGTLRVPTADHLAAMKVKAYSERKKTPKGESDRKDVLRLIGGGHAGVEAIRTLLLKHRPDLLPELDEILVAGAP